MTGCFAQEAELKTLTAAYTMKENQRTNIYTDSHYAIWIAHDFGPIWKSRDFMGLSGKPVKHAELIRALFTALQLSKKKEIPTRGMYHIKRMFLYLFYIYIYKRTEDLIVPILCMGNIKTQSQVLFDKVSSCRENRSFVKKQVV